MARIGESREDSRIGDDRIRFRGICLNGPLKGKEIEGRLNIEFNIESVRPGRMSSESGFGSLAVLLLLILGINFAVVRLTSSPQPNSQLTPASQELELEEPLEDILFIDASN